jgi:hypothetical protein
MHNTVECSGNEHLDPCYGQLIDKSSHLVFFSAANKTVPQFTGGTTRPLHQKPLPIATIRAFTPRYSVFRYAVTTRRQTQPPYKQAHRLTPKACECSGCGESIQGNLDLPCDEMSIRLFAVDGLTCRQLA